MTGFTLSDLEKTIAERARSGDPDSWTAKLFSKGIDKAAQKLGEEAVETVIAGLGGEREELAAESADLLFHLLVLWAARDLRPEDVWRELERRRASSGIDEKAGRKGGS